jgi:DNA-binding SARP family transcriptional activator
MPALRIQTLGPFRLWREEQLIPPEAWPTHKSLALFKILLTERGHFVPADRLIEYLWPELPPGRARNNLWVSVSQARRALQPDLPRRAAGDFILTRREGYTFSPDAHCSLDADSFTSHLLAARRADQTTEQIKALESARELYRGDYLEEDPYEDWALAMREQLRNDYLALLADLAHLYARQGQYRRAISLCHESLARESTDEAVFRQLMLYHYAAGEQNSALRMYAECSRVLRAELGVEPTQETRELYHQMQRRQVVGVDHDARYPPPVEPVPLPFSLGRTPLVARDREYGHLASLVTAAAAGQGQVALVEGEPGVGKSRLVQEVARFAETQGVRTLVGQCYQVEQVAPYQPIIDLARRIVSASKPDTLRRLPAVWLAELTALVPEMTELVPDLPPTPASVDPSRQGRMFEALVRMLVAHAAEDGLVLIVDDVQWADPSTLRFLHHLARSIADHPVLLICTLGSEAAVAHGDLASFVYSLKQIPHMQHFSLARLSEHEVQTLLESMGSLPALALELAAWLHCETEGNPFFMVLMLQSLLEQGFLSMGAQTEWQLAPQALREAGAELTLPEALRESVRDRLRRVPRDWRRVLEMAAVLGRGFDFTTLQVVTQEETHRLLDAVDGLVARRLLEEREDNHYQFTHDKICEVLYHDLSGPRASALHLQVAEALEAQAGDQPGATASILAHHFERAGEPARAVRYWLSAGDHALATCAPLQAIRQYERALALATDPADRVQLFWGLGRAHAGQEDAQAAIANLTQGLRLTEEGDPRRALMLNLLADLQPN